MILPSSFLWPFLPIRLTFLLLASLQIPSGSLLPSSEEIRPLASTKYEEFSENW